MTDCEETLTLLSRQLDTAQASFADSDLERLIPATDPDCRAQARAMLGIDAQLREAPLLSPRRDLSAAILAGITQKPRHDERLLALMLFLSTSFAVAPTVLLIGGLLASILILINPAAIQIIVPFLLDVLHNFYALFLTLSTLQRVLSPWALPVLLLMFSSLFLVLTLVAVRRLSLHTVFSEEAL